MNRRAQLNRWLAALKGFERTLLGNVGRARNALILHAAEVYRRTGSVPAYAKEAHRKRVEAIIIKHYNRVIPHFGDMALSQIKSVPVRVEYKRRLFADLAAEWIKREALRKARLIADTDFEDVTNAIAAGFGEGEGTDAIARRIRKVTALTPFRAATVARTETHAAASFGSIESIRSAGDELGVKMNKEWLATRDDRTRPDHLAADGQQVELDGKFSVGGEMMDRPGDPSASPEQLINCLHPNSVLQSGYAKNMTRHWFEGVMVVAETIRGSKLTVTPNHPVLTRKGWVPASALKKGDDVIGGAGFQGVRLGDLYVGHVIATAQQIYDALDVHGRGVRVRAVDVDFHGERPSSDVDVVWATRKLRNARIAALGKPLEHLRLACTDFAQGRLLAHRLLLGVRLMELRRRISNRFVSIFRDAFSLLRRCCRHADIHALAASARLNPVVGEAEDNMAPLLPKGRGQRLDRLASLEASSNLGGVTRPLRFFGGRGALADGPKLYSSAIEPSVDRGGRDFVSTGKSRNGRPSEVFVDQIIDVSHMAYSGYVYNLETHNGYYICNGVVQHNCRCGMTFEEA